MRAIDLRLGDLNISAQPLEFADEHDVDDEGKETDRDNGADHDRTLLGWLTCGFETGLFLYCEVHVQLFEYFSRWKGRRVNITFGVSGGALVH